MIHSTKAENVDQYIANAPEKAKAKLLQMRSIILKAAPKAEESIGYMMPAYKLNGVLVYFGGYKKHIGFYPTASGIENFKNELEGYATSKGAIQFPLDKPLPTRLITQIVQFRALENLEKKESKKKR
jgi:uncharacterized protein YdhG (YjbR/CyaY superfamily)